jgi:DNA-binding response OmpR family regulator
MVEDDRDHREIISAALIHAGVNVIHATDGVQDVEMALAEHPEVVLTDAGLPLLDGWKATATIKRSEPTMCVIIISAHALPEHRDGGDGRCRWIPHKAN